MFCNCHVCLFLERCEKRGSFWGAAKICQTSQPQSSPTPQFMNKTPTFTWMLKLQWKEPPFDIFVPTMTVHIEDLSSGLWASVIPPSLWGVPIHLSAGIQQLSPFSPPCFNIQELKICVWGGRWNGQEYGASIPRMMFIAYLWLIHIVLNAELSHQGAILKPVQLLTWNTVYKYYHQSVDNL